MNHLYDLTRFGSFLWIIIMTKMAVYLDTSVTKIERKPTAVLVSIEPMANPGSTRLPHTAWDGRLKSGISTVSSLRRAVRALGSIRVILCLCNEVRGFYSAAVWHRQERADKYKKNKRPFYPSSAAVDR